MKLREIGTVVAWVVLAVVIVCQRPVVALQEVPQGLAEQENAVKQLHQAHSVARDERGLVGSRLVAEINRDA